MTDAPVQADPRRRPFGVLVVAAIQIIRAALLIGQLLGYRIGVDWLRMSAQVPEPAPGTVAFALSRGLAIALILSSLVVALGLLSGRRWGWIGAIILSGLALALALGAWLDGAPTYISMAINVVAVFYLNQREVRAAFEETPGDVPPTQEPT
ncbi:MAG TPA: hypothetical protein VFV72_04600 [Candidatus Limnocylindrales bacterium]|nr:hypothetical protein [Candidatus Limnocylindrales bacterium]